MRSALSLFAAVLFLQLQAGFQRVRVRLVDFVGKIGFFDPLARRRDAQLRIAGGDLLDGNDDLHESTKKTFLATHERR